jgi:drug/metabolite transporter (DMT)-like permease
MDPTIFLWTLAATVAAGFHVFVSKVTAQRGLNGALNGVFSYGIPALISLGIFGIYFHLPVGWEWVAFWAALDGLLYGIGSVIRIESLRHIDSTIYFPINKILGPALIVIGGVVLFAEHITPLQWLGIGGAFLIPLLLIERTEHARQKNLRKGLLLCVASTLIIVASTVAIKYGLAYADSLWFFMVIANSTAALTSLALYAKSISFSQSNIRVTKTDISTGLAVGTLGFISVFTFCTALQAGYISIVYTIHAHYILIPIFLSVWWYGEHMNLRKFAAVALSCVTLMLLY